MQWPVVTPPVPDAEVPLWNQYYTSACRRSPADPTIVWGTGVDVSALNDSLHEINSGDGRIVTTAHVLAKSVGTALARHSEMNCRLIGRHLYRFKAVNVLMPLQKRRPPETDVMLLEEVDRKSLPEIAEEVWRHNRDAARGEFLYDREPPVYTRLPRWLMHRLFPLHLWLVNRFNLPVHKGNKRQRTAAAVVNYLGFDGAAPLHSFKPSRFPSDSCTLNVTMGAARSTPVVVDGEVVPRPVAPLFLRGDHRIADAYQIGRLAATIRTLLSEPRLRDHSPRDVTDGSRERPSPTRD